MPKFTNSDVSYAKHKLAYPIFAAEFDPYNRGYLIVGGGGGESKSGVPNQISVLDVSQRPVIKTALEIDLSREEDSVQSLASLATKDGLITFAGINSSQAQVDANNNEHFRSFDIIYPPRKKQKTDEAGVSADGAIKPLGKRKVFKPSLSPKKETYQRLLRLSPVQKRDAPSKRVGAIASGLAQENELIVFNATVALPEDTDIITKISLPEKQEAADLDIAQAGEDEFSLAYCDEHNIYEQTFKYDFNKKEVEKTPNGPRRVHEMPHSDSFQNPKSRPKFRCIRFLNAQNLVALVNKPNKGGAELRLYHLYPTGPALEMQSKGLPAHIKQSSTIDVCPLDTDKNGNQQFAIAVAGQDITVELYTINYQSASDTFSSFTSFMTLRDVHDQQITKLTWSPFFSPPVDSAPTSHKPLPTQYIRLASVSYGNTVVVDTFPLSLLDARDRESRHVLSHPDTEAFWKWAYIIVGSFIALVTAFLFQSFTSAGFTGSSSDIGIWSYVPENVREYLDQPAIAAQRGIKLSKVTEAITQPTEYAQLLKDTVAEHLDSSDDAAAAPKAVVVRDVPEGSGIDVAVHDDKEAYLAQDTEAKHWDELEDHQKRAWKEKLIKAGQWAEHEGEAVLKGVLWSTWAGLVGQAGEILRGEL